MFVSRVKMHEFVSLSLSKEADLVLPPVWLRRYSCISLLVFFVPLTFINSANFIVFIPLHCNVLLCRIEACTLLEKIKKDFICLYMFYLISELHVWLQDGSTCWAEVCGVGGFSFEDQLLAFNSDAMSCGTSAGAISDYSGCPATEGSLVKFSLPPWLYWNVIEQDTEPLIAPDG